MTTDFKFALYFVLTISRPYKIQMNLIIIKNPQNLTPLTVFTFTICLKFHDVIISHAASIAAAIC